MRIGDLESHPAADAFPVMGGIEYERLREDVKDRGFLDRKIWLLGGAILDGRHRYRVSLELGLAVELVTYEGDDPIGFALARNYHRRQLNESQRALVAVRLATLKQGRRRKTGTSAGLTQHELATALNVGERTIREARTVLDHPELAVAIERGELTVREATRLAERPAAEQGVALEQLLAKSSRKAQAKPATDAAVVLARQLVRTVQEAGASAIDFTPDARELDIRLRFRGRAFVVSLRETGKAA